MTAPTHGNNSEALNKPSFLDRFFLNIERFAYTHSIAVILISSLIAGLSVWVTIDKLSFKKNRGDLVAKKLDYVENYEKYRQEFEDFDGMMVIVTDEDSEKMKEFSDSFVNRLKQFPQNFSKVFYKIDTEYFRQKGLLYLDQEELIDLGIKIESHESFLEEVNTSPGLNQLIKSINAEISTGMVDSLLTGFLGGSDNKNGKDETADLGLLIALEKQMLAHLQGKTSYRSPSRSFGFCPFSAPFTIPDDYDGESFTYNFSMSPVLEAGQTRMVLNWGATPHDLDSHLLTPDIEGSTHHIYYGNVGSYTAVPYAKLDTDDIDGYGPETITISQAFSGTYAYYIKNFNGASDGLKNSSAVTQVYSGESCAATIIEVPTDTDGLYWYVCDVDGASGDITVVNQIQNSAP